jgi:beta-lactamase class D
MLKPKIYLGLLFFFYLLVHLNLLVADEVSFLVQENNTILQKQGDVTRAFVDYSTLKIALSVIGFNEGILIDETDPQIDCDKNNEASSSWMTSIFRNSYNPRTWLRHEHGNCTYGSVWYSDWILQQLGIEKLQKYLASFQYGESESLKFSNNQRESIFLYFKNNLKISTEEQVVFLQKLLASQLPASPRAQEITRNNLYMDRFPNGWKLYGKCCTGPHDTFLGPHGTWFVGWIEKGEHKIIFAYHSYDCKNALLPFGILAKGIVKEKLQMMIFSMK